MIEFEFDQGMLAQIEKRLGAAKAEAPRALKNALNATARQARRDLATEARKTYTVKIGGFNSQMRIKNATAGNLEAIIKSRGENLELKKFSVNGGRGGAHLSTTINRNNGRKTFGSNAFMNKIAQNGHVAAAIRQGRERLPIKKIFSLPVPSMIGNERDVYGVVEPNIMDNLQSNVDKQVSKILGA